MRHMNSGRKLNRTPSHRRAMVRNLVASLFAHGRVTTTPAKAKEARPFAEKLITLAKGGTLADRRRALKLLHDKKVVAQLFNEIGPRYLKRPGGYCRILHLAKRRVGDAAPQAVFELVEEALKQQQSGGGEPARAAVAAPSAPAVGEAPKSE